MRRPWPKIAFATALIIASCGVALYKVSRDNGGIKNVLSRSYWQARAAGRDEYQPELAWFRRGPRSQKVVCLTIDDGPHGASTQAILDELHRARVPATFFVVGKMITQHPNLVREMISEGHEVGNHTENHPRLDTISLPNVRKELEECGQAVASATGHRMTLFRPPGMKDTPAILALAKQMGYHTIDWNVGAQDYVSAAHPQEASVDEMVDKVVRNVRDGSIILLHDQKLTADALPALSPSCMSRDISSFPVQKPWNSSTIPSTSRRTR